MQVFAPVLRVMIHGAVQLKNSLTLQLSTGKTVGCRIINDMYSLVRNQPLIIEKAIF